MTLTLKDRDFYLLIDASGSMGTQLPNGQTRWKAAEEGTLAIARKANQFDTDGLTLVVFSGRPKLYDNVTDKDVARIFNENEPNGSMNLAAALKMAFDKINNAKNPNGNILVIVTDGAPDSESDVTKAIIEQTKKQEKDEDLGILFVQIGDDFNAKKFLTMLDDDLEKEGAKFDIVDTMTMDDVGDKSLTEVLEAAILG